MTIAKGKYNPTVHAVERIREYFDIMEENAKEYVNKLMRDAKYVTTGHNGLLTYKNVEKDVMLVVNAEKKIIVTVLPPAGEGKRNANVVKPVEVSPNNAIIAAARATIQRELTKARRIFTQEFRKLSLEQAELGVEIAQASVNKVRCKAPHTQAIIQERIDSMQTYYDLISKEISDKKSEYERMKNEAKAFIGEEVQA